MTAPWLTVIIPTYNGAARYLPAALESIVAQDDPNIEVIAVDYGSTDATLTILDSFASRLPLTIIQRRVGNWVANTNLGLEHAHGEVACFLHQDDLWRPGRLAAVRFATRRSQTLSASAWLRCAAKREPNHPTPNRRRVHHHYRPTSGALAVPDPAGATRQQQ